MKRAILILAVLLLLPGPVLAKKVGGVEIPDQIKAGDTTVKLNGSGIRKKFVFVKVYAGGLYLPKPVSHANAEQVIKADEPQAIVMGWIKDDIEKKQVEEAWVEGFVRATNGNLEPIKDEVQTFYNVMPDPYKKGDILEFIYIPGTGTRVVINGAEKAVLPGLAFKEALWGNWLGPKPPDGSLEDLKEDMLND